MRGGPDVEPSVWEFLLPRLAPGLHVVVVHAIDEFGFEDEEVMTFEVLDRG